VQGGIVGRREDVEYWIGRLALGLLGFVMNVVVSVQKLFTEKEDKD
jgi:hypothetical protein